MASPTYSLIASTALTSSQATVTFSSIPSTYTDLVLRCSIRTDDTAASDGLRIQFNSDTNTNYSDTSVTGSGSAASSTKASSRDSYQLFYVSANTGTSNTFGNLEIYIPSYTNSANKSISGFAVQENNTTAGFIRSDAGLWRGTSAITQIDITPYSAINFMTNSTFYLYGIKNA